MSKIKFITFIILISAFVFACGNSKTKKAAGGQPEVKKGVAPVADNEIAVIELENSAAYGTIKIDRKSVV